MYVFARSHDVLWKDLMSGSPQKLNLGPLLNSGLGFLSSMLMDNFVLGLLKVPLPPAARQNWGSGAFKPAKGFSIKAAPCSVLGYFWESCLGGKERYVH